MARVLIQLTGIKPNGNKICAIKNVRVATGLGLKESKDVVDQLGSFEADASHLPLFDEDVTYTMRHIAGPVSPHKEKAMENMRDFAKELLDAGKWDAAQNVCNLLSILTNVEDYDKK